MIDVLESSAGGIKMAPVLKEDEQHERVGRELKLTSEIHFPVCCRLANEAQAQTHFK